MQPTNGRMPHVGPQNQGNNQNVPYLAILLVTFLRWLSDPFKGESWPPTIGIKRSGLESPGTQLSEVVLFYRGLQPTSDGKYGFHMNGWCWSINIPVPWIDPHSLVKKKGNPYKWVAFVGMITISIITKELYNQNPSHRSQPSQPSQGFWFMALKHVHKTTQTCFRQLSIPIEPRKTTKKDSYIFVDK